MKKAKVFLKNKFAGILMEDEEGFVFHYDKSFLDSEEAEAISLHPGMTWFPHTW